MANNSRKSWNLESFLDSLIVELDKVQDTLAVKTINRPLSYTVKDVGFDLQIFPQFDGKSLRFDTAKPGESGASKISIQLGSITDRQAREVTKDPVTRDDISLEQLDDIDEDTKDTLKKIGVNSAKDLEKMSQRNIDLKKVSKKNIDYQKLAGVLDKARRRSRPPSVARVNVNRTNPEGKMLSLEGENLALSRAMDMFPAAFVNEKPVEIFSATEKRLDIVVADDHLQSGSNQLTVALDPHTIFKLELKS